MKLDVVFDNLRSIEALATSPHWTPDRKERIATLARLSLECLEKHQKELQAEQLEEEGIKCFFCDATVPDVPTAIRLEWSPDFFDGEDPVSEPVCPDCVTKYLEIDDESGELVKKK